MLAAVSPIVSQRGRRQLAPEAALALAVSIARQLAWRNRLMESDVAAELASEALLALMAGGTRINAATITDAVTIATRARCAEVRARSRFLTAASREARLLAASRITRDPIESIDPIDPIDWSGPIDPIEIGGQPVPAPMPRTHRFLDGATLLAPARIDCPADAAEIELRLSGNHRLRGQPAFAACLRRLVAERRRAHEARQSTNAARAVSALERDGALLEVVGLPWRQALARLASRGIVITRDGLRSGQRAARLRAVGKTAHDRARPRRSDGAAQLASHKSAIH